MTVSIDVIVRTLADRDRAISLFVALDSIQEQEGASARPIVVVNGGRTDDGVLAALAKRPGICVCRIPEASAGRAMSEGRKRVTAPYFGYLDDDDTLAPGSLRGPLEWMDATLACDVLVTNGRFVKQDGTAVESTHIAKHVADPLVGLMTECWLSPGAFIGRTATLADRFFEFGWGHMEWTRLAFELCAERKRICFLDVHTVNYNDTPESMSKRPAQREASARLWRWVRDDERFNRAVRAGAKCNYARVLHNLAWQYWLDGNHRRAWQCHLASLRSRQMLRYLAFTRKLVVPRKGGVDERPAAHVTSKS